MTGLCSETVASAVVLLSEFTDEGAATAGIAPRNAERISAVAAVLSNNGHRMHEMRGKRSVIGFFVVADLIVHSDGARGELHDVADGKRFKSHAARISREGYRREIHGDNIIEQSCRLRLRKGNERGLLCAIGMRVDEKHGFCRKRIAVRI